MVQVLEKHLEDGNEKYEIGWSPLSVDKEVFDLKMLKYENFIQYIMFASTVVYGLRSSQTWVIPIFMIQKMQEKPSAINLVLKANPFFVTRWVYVNVCRFCSTAPRRI